VRETFKVICLKNGSQMTYAELRAAEHMLGAVITGKADMRSPGHLFGAAPLLDGRWLFGDLQVSEPVWLRHNDKPRQYSTALGTRTARAIANIAVPNPNGVRAIDPCCGIGTVVIEALSMGIDMVGFDINPQAVAGARLNLSHFGYPDVIRRADMRVLDGHYDAAVLDLPYNLCSVLSKEVLGEMLGSMRKLTDMAVIVTTGDMDHDLGQAGFTVTDRCHVSKGSFSRHVLVCS
jgi:tRNA G10  N-methylase Trm11